MATGPNTLLLAAAFAVVTAILYAYVGRVILRRNVEGDAKLATAIFATFWIALGAATAAGSINTVMGWAGLTDVSLYVTTAQVSLLVILVAIWALVYYLAYLFTGNRTLLVPISAYYLAFYGVIVYLLAIVDFNEVIVEDWRVRLGTANQLAPFVGVAFVIALIAPPLVGAVAYARLFFKVEGATQRYRIGLVSGTIVAWFGTSLAASLLQQSTSPWWQVTSRVIGVAAALLVYFAYRPPQWIRTRYGIEAAEERPT